MQLEKVLYYTLYNMQAEIYTTDNRQVVVKIFNFRNNKEETIFHPLEDVETIIANAIASGWTTKKQYKYRKIDYIKAMNYYGWKRKRAAMIVNRNAWENRPQENILVYEWMKHK